MTPFEQIMADAAKRKQRERTWIAVGAASVFLFVMVMAAINKDDKPKDAATAPLVSREEKIAAQFSQWDGSHRALVETVKRSMHDPESFDHAETKYFDNGTTIVVAMSYRGNNSFGAKVLNTIQAEVDEDGRILKIFDK